MKFIFENGSITLIVFYCFCKVEAAYFSMTNVQMNIPGEKSKYPSTNHALLTLNALKENELDPENRGKHLRYSIKFIGERLLQVYASTGDIMFTEMFFLRDVSNISVVAYVEDTVKITNDTEVHVNILQDSLIDCELMTRDLCYWQSATYRIFENSEPSVIGSLSSSYLAEICTKHKINYTLIKGGNQFSLVPPSDDNKSWSLRTLELLDRDVHLLLPPFDKKADGTGGYRNLIVKCTVENERGSISEILKDISVQVLDENDNPPKLQKHTDNVNIEMNSNIAHKGEVIQHQDLTFIDRDSPSVNQYNFKLLDDDLHILEPKCEQFEDDRLEEIQTFIHCQLVFTKDVNVSRSPYSVVLGISDTTLRTGFGDKLIKIPINIYFKSFDNFPKSAAKPMPTTKPPKPRLLYPSGEIHIFRTASLFARVTQPSRGNLGDNIKAFEINHDSTHGAFNVTFTEGIVYVNNVTYLRNSSRAELTIQWKKGNTIEMDKLIITIIAEPTHTCTEYGPQGKKWGFCASFKSKKNCIKGCGLSTGGTPGVQRRKMINQIERCMWRGEEYPGNNTTHLYATCTPDISTCPDGVCDALEDLNNLICPQDCARHDMIIFPMAINKNTKRGFDVGTGICFCEQFGCSCEYAKRPKTKPKIIATTISPLFLTVASILYNSSITGRNISYEQPNVSRQISTDLARCGTACILGIAGSAVFLLFIIGGIVFRWQIERVHKTVREKFLTHTTELQVPLSDYIDRGRPPDTLQFNFDVTTTLTSQMNGFEPDSKWEFPRSQLIIEQTLGEGEFGRVLRARAFAIAGQSGHTTVAVKTLKKDAGERELSDLFSEYQLLKEVSHPNVIRLLGASTSPGGPFYLIIEFAEHGSLRNYLRRSRHIQTEPVTTTDKVNQFRFSSASYDEPKICQITPKDILSFAWQIANGMSYLRDIKLVHRDLAARNVLVASEKICKISDFGLTRDIYEDDAYFKKSKGRVPVKWMAPESLSDHIYTNKSDVWSFGILLWELITLGASPYPGIMVQSLFHLLKTGYRMERPENCSVALYKVMRSCWHLEPEKRPTFSNLSLKFEQMLSNQVQYLDLTGNAVNNRGYFCDNLNDSEDERELENSNENTKAEATNYLNKTLDYEKCGNLVKIQIPNEETDQLLVTPNTNIENNVGYETPIKIPNKSEEVKTPGNEFPQYGYTDMSAGSAK